MKSTLPQELRKLAEQIRELSAASPCFSVVTVPVQACCDHIDALAGNVEKNQRIEELTNKEAAFHQVI